jgi:uroporphyrinogen-III synthase
MTPNFNGLRVLALESRRATEIAALITTYGGQPLVAPALREVPLESNPEALAFAKALLAGQFDAVILLTGVGTRVLVSAVEAACPRDAFLAALRRTKIVARGPKPLAVLRDLQVPVWAAAAEPNTWREILAAMDAKPDELALAGARLAVQEYGVSNTDLLDGLRERGAIVTRVPVYRWALPEDTGPLKNAIRAIVQGEIDVVVVTSGVQIAHLWQLAAEAGVEPEVQRQLANAVLASIGPSTSAELRLRGLEPDMEPSHPKMGVLVREAAEKSDAILKRKRASKGT